MHWTSVRKIGAWRRPARKTHLFKDDLGALELRLLTIPTRRSDRLVRCTFQLLISPRTAPFDPRAVLDLDWLLR
jgi:hypothetical protein